MGSEGVKGLSGAEESARILSELVKLLALDRIEENLFRGQSQDLGWGVVFGGQVLGQALSAAVQTVPAERLCHSMHAYFLRPGNVHKPIVYDVDRIRDGGSFTTRRVVAIQAGEPIFNLAASFQKVEAGFEHQDEIPKVAPPESLPSSRDRALALAEQQSPIARERILAERPFEMRPTEPDDPGATHPLRPPRRMVWIRAMGKLPDDPALHGYLLAYVSDHSFITTALLPHGVTVFAPGMQVASLDHVMWFHQPFRMDEWLLYAIDSPAAHGARGLVRGRIFSQDGRLVASCAQEGLIRKRT
jgi:acyl-CoA thioesterase-2